MDLEDNEEEGEKEKTKEKEEEEKEKKEEDGEKREENSYWRMFEEGEVPLPLLLSTHYSFIVLLRIAAASFASSLLISL